jgi:hypothetical protein
MSDAGADGRTAVQVRNEVQMEQGITPTREDVLAVVELRPEPLTVGDIGLEIARSHGHDLAGAQDAPVGQRLADAGLSLSGVQKLVDGLVTEELVVEVRGRNLYASGLPTVGTKAARRYFLHRRTVEAARAAQASSAR